MKTQKMEKTEIKKIVLEVSGREITVSLEDAKKLKDLLNELFGKEIIKEIRVDHYPYKPYWDYTRPYILCDSGSTAKFSPNKHTLFCSVGTKASDAPAINHVASASTTAGIL